jgi:hypothetical protein
MTSRMTLLGTFGPIGCGGSPGRRWLACGVAGLGMPGMALLGLLVAAAAEPDVVPQRQIDQRLAQARQGFRSAAHAELELVRRTCGSLAKASRPALVAAADRGVERAAQEFVDRQMAARGGQGFEARQHVYDAIVPVLEPLVSADEFAAYQQERAARIARRARASRLRIMDNLTTTLDLSTAQTAAIETDLRECWQPGWLMEVDDTNSMANAPRPAPDFAAEAITPHLDERQRTAWEEWCRRAAASKVRITRGWESRPSQPDPWWQP